MQEEEEELSAGKLLKLLKFRQPGKRSKCILCSPNRIKTCRTVSAASRQNLLSDPEVAVETVPSSQPEGGASKESLIKEE